MLMTVNNNTVVGMQAHLVAGAALQRVSQVANDDVKKALSLLQLGLGVVVDQHQAWVIIGSLVLLRCKDSGRLKRACV